MGARPESHSYAARLSVDYPDTLSRASTAFRLILIIPISLLFGILSTGTQFVQVTTNSSTDSSYTAGDYVSTTTGSILGGIMMAIGLMIVFRQRYPRWWFDFALELMRFAGRIGAYAVLLTDRYPSTEDTQSVHIEIDYPDVKRDLNRWLPLVKWFLAIPHYFLLGILGIGAFFAIVIAWFAILFTGKYPRGLFDYVVGVWRWGLRVSAYASLLVTDEYPPFSLDP